MDKHYLEALGRSMAYVETGAGAPILFQHGNPTSSYLWRNVMPHVASQGRCLAVDLIGMGDSDKLPGEGPMRYSFAAQCEHLYAAWDQLIGDEPAVLVLHDWGGALGFHWARRNPERVRAVVYMETLVAPVDDWSDWPENAQNIFQLLRSDAGEAMVLEKNMFVERILPASIIRDLSEEEMAEYRRPFAAAGEDRRPTLDWPRQIPIAGEPEGMARILKDYAAFMAASPMPKLFIDAQPGSILTGKVREACLKWPNQQVVEVKGAHFIQEDSPDEIGQAIAAFVAGL